MDNCSGNKINAQTNCNRSKRRRKRRSTRNQGSYSNIENGDEKKCEIVNSVDSRIVPKPQIVELIQLFVSWNFLRVVSTIKSPKNFTTQQYAEEKLLSSKTERIKTQELTKKPIKEQKVSGKDLVQQTHKQKSSQLKEAIVHNKESNVLTDRAGTDQKYCNKTYPGPTRRRRNRRSKKKIAGNSNSNKTDVVGSENRKFVEDEILKKGLEKKIQEDDKGCELLVKMGYENGKGLGQKSEGVLEPLMAENLSNRKKLCTKIYTQKPKSTVKLIKGGNDTFSNKKILNQNPKKLIEVDKTPKLNSEQQTKKSKPEQEKTVLAQKKPEVANTASKSERSFCLKSKKETFSVSDHLSPELIETLCGAFFKLEILIQSRLKHEASLHPTHSDNDVMIAEIHIENNSNLTDHMFEFIRTELVGWIGVYQQQGMDTPIFHSMENMHSHLTIVCDNKYAYECIERCVEDILQMNTIGSIKIFPVPPVTSIIYCFESIYEGIASDSNLFLSQLKLHKPKLYSNNWLVAFHKVCSEERKTFFIFLVDERSALALNFVYNRSFYVCMQQVTFRNHGIVGNTNSK